MNSTIVEAQIKPGAWLQAFEIAAGSIQGYEHQRLGKNNQDAYGIYYSSAALIVVVCDGCSSGRHSEVGSRLAVQWIPTRIQQQLQVHAVIEWEQLQQDLITDLRGLLNMMGGSAACIEDYLLFTLVGAILTPEQVYLFSIGDGVYSFNDQIYTLGPFEQNAPPYLAYGLGSRPAPRFQVHHQIPLADFNSLMVGTDGVSDLIQCQDCYFPGQSRQIGAIQQFWQDPRYFKNPDQIRRTLCLINREVVQPNWDQKQLVKCPGLLPDDTTLVVVRRRSKYLEEGDL